MLDEIVLDTKNMEKSVGILNKTGKKRIYADFLYWYEKRVLIFNNEQKRRGFRFIHM